MKAAGIFNIYAPDEARTKDSILILWDKLNEGNGKLSYDIWVDGKAYKTVDCTDDTLTGLSLDTAYAVQVKAWFDGREYCTEEITVKTKSIGKIYDITAFGAVAEEGQVNTEAIQNAIDACEVGGTVYVPEGVFYTGALFLHSNMTLELAEGAVLIGTGNVMDFKPFYYPFEGRWERCFASLLNVRTLPECENGNNSQHGFDTYENIAVIGKGVLDGNGEVLFHEELKEHGRISRGRTVCIRNTTGLYFYGITVKNSPAWCLHPVYCKNMTINQIRISNKFGENGKAYSHFNGDGIDPDSCQEVFICHSFIQSQDDSIALKSGREPFGNALHIPTKNIRISNCKLSYGFGIVVGSEMSGGVTNVLVQDIDMKETFCAVNLKTRRGRGAGMADITYENLNLEIKEWFCQDDKWFRGIICVDQFYGDDSAADVDIPHIVDDGTSEIAEVVIKNVTMDVTNRPSIYICGLPEQHVKNITLSNIKIKGGNGFQIKNVDELTMRGVESLQEADGKESKQHSAVPVHQNR